MARRGTGRKISVLNVKNFGPVDIRMDQDGVFNATIQGVLLTDAIKANLEAQVTKEIELRTNMKWIPVIRVDDLGRKQDATDTSVEVSIEIERYWVAKLTTGGWVRADWDDQNPRLITERRGKDRRTQNSREITGYDFDKLGKEPVMYERSKGRYSYHGDEVYMPYTDEAWAGLQDIKARLIELDKALAKIVGTIEGQKQLGKNTLPVLLALPSGKHGR